MIYIWYIQNSLNLFNCLRALKNSNIYLFIDFVFVLHPRARRICVLLKFFAVLFSCHIACNKTNKCLEIGKLSELAWCINFRAQEIHNI